MNDYGVNLNVDVDGVDTFGNDAQRGTISINESDGLIQIITFYKTGGGIHDRKSIEIIVKKKDFMRMARMFIGHEEWKEGEGIR